MQNERRHTAWTVSLLLAALVHLAAANPSRAATSRERGYPILQRFGVEAHGGGVQSYSVHQSSDGLIWIGNLGGLLVYDGASWKSYSLANYSAVYAVGSDARGRIAAGGFEEFGIFEPDETGDLAYRSLSAQLPAEQANFGDVRCIYRNSQGLWFITSRFIFVSDGESVNAVAGPIPESARVLPVGDRIYVSSVQGLTRIDAQGITPIELDDPRGGRIDLLLPASGDDMLAVIRGEGLAMFDGSGLESFGPESSTWTGDREISSGVWLPDGRWVLGSRDAGLLVVMPDGSIDRSVDNSVGLPDNNVQGMTLDSNGALWLALDSNIARVEITPASR